jgi:hypothetical protein
MNFNLSLVMATVVLGLGATYAQSTTDADERYRAKYGRYPARVEAQHHELQMAWKEKAEHLFNKVDGNKDGSITKREWHQSRELLSRAHRAKAVADHDDHFYALDANDDGKVSKEEWKGGL